MVEMTERELEIRALERRRIADHMTTLAENVLRDPDSDAIDGYTAAVLLDLANAIRENGGGQ